VKVSLVGIELLSIEARVVIASVETYLKYAEAIGLTATAAAPAAEAVGQGRALQGRPHGSPLESGPDPGLRNSSLFCLRQKARGMRGMVMEAHFSSFTPEAMRAFGQELAADSHRRRELLDRTRRQTAAFLADFRGKQREAATERKQRAGREADGRRLFVSELRSGVHALKNRFELARRDLSTELRQMAGRLGAAQEAFRNRPPQLAGSSARKGARPTAQPSAAMEGDPGFRPGTEGEEGGRRHGHSKRR
jgi:uncharacterized protein YukE